MRLLSLPLCLLRTVTGQLEKVFNEINWHLIFSEFHFQTETKVDILTGVQRHKVNSVSKWMSPSDDCIRVIFPEKLKTTEAHEYAQNIT